MGAFKKRLFSGVFCAAGGLFLVGCGGPPAPCYAVNGKQARAMHQPGTILLDVRTREEHDAGPVSGAVHIPEEELSYRMKYVSNSNRIIVFGQDGASAKRAAKVLRKAGYVVYELGPLEDLNSDQNKCE